HGGHPTGWANPWVLSGLAAGVVLLIAFGVIETKIPEPMFRMRLFSIRAFAAGNAASLLGSIARGGLQFMLVIWLAGIWLPLHGYAYADTPLWAGIYMLPLTTGFLVAGPVSGYLSDRYGTRLFATAGLHAQGVPLGVATRVSHLPPVSTVFAALLGYNPVQHLLSGSGVLATLPPHRVAVLTGTRFFPHLISAPFHHGLIIVFSAAA